MKTMFSTPEAAAIVGAPKQNVDYWARIGLATATVPAKGTGSDRLYSYDDLIVLAALFEVSDTSVATRRVIARVLRLSDLRKGTFLNVRLSPVAHLVFDVGLIRKRIAARILETGLPARKAAR